MLLPSQPIECMVTFREADIVPQQRLCRPSCLYMIVSPCSLCASQLEMLLTTLNGQPFIDCLLHVRALSKWILSNDPSGFHQLLSDVRHAI